MRRFSLRRFSLRRFSLRSLHCGAFTAEPSLRSLHCGTFTANSHCGSPARKLSFSASIVVYNEWLAVAGGWDGGRLSSVEVMNTDSKQWYAAPPTPTPWSRMRTAIVGDTCYFMGGYTGGCIVATTVVYSVSLPALISQLRSLDSRERGKQHQIWKEIPRLQTTRSTPLSIRGSLFAVGGVDRDDKAVTAILLYQPDTGEWVKVGDLPTPRYWSTCAMITDTEMLVAGGNHTSSSCVIALINAP